MMALWDVYNDQPMGNCAEVRVEKYKMTREELDELAIDSLKEARQPKKKVFSQKKLRL